MTPSQVSAVRDSMVSDQNAGPSPLACKFDPYLRDHMTGSEVDEKELSRIKENAKAFIEAAHAEAIKRLREELRNDPDGRGYTGKTDEELQVLLTTEKVVYENEKSEDGRVYQREVLRSPPRLGTIWTGIPYTRNKPSLDNIAEALAK